MCPQTSGAHATRRCAYDVCGYYGVGERLRVYTEDYAERRVEEVCEMVC